MPTAPHRQDPVGLFRGAWVIDDTLAATPRKTLAAVREFAHRNPVLVIGGDPAAFAGYYRWDVYYYTSAGEVLLPIGYAETSRIPVAGYLATHPQ
jgi:UDP-N-acetylmuramoylalanine-D-glutamate ligase